MKIDGKETNSVRHFFFDGVDKVMKSLPSKALPAILGTALLLGNPSDSFAARSGGRSGGSSFRSGGGGGYRPSTRVYSGGSSYGYASRPSINIMPAPMFSPFGFGGGFGFGYTPFIPINGNLLLLGGLAYLAYTVLSSRVGGSDFSNSREAGSLGTGATVLKLQVALDSDWADSSNIMNTLSSLASRRGGSVLGGRSELSALLSEASLALLRRRSSWSAAAIDGENFGNMMSKGGSIDRAEPFFQRVAVQERAKFESESNGRASESGGATNGGLLLRDDAGSGSKPTQAVVSLIVAIRGQSDALRSVRYARLALEFPSLS